MSFLHLLLQFNIVKAQKFGRQVRRVLIASRPSRLLTQPSTTNIQHQTAIPGTRGGSVQLIVHSSSSSQSITCARLVSSSFLSSTHSQGAIEVRSSRLRPIIYFQHWNTIYNRDKCLLSIWTRSTGVPTSLGLWVGGFLVCDKPAFCDFDIDIHHNKLQPFDLHQHLLYLFGLDLLEFYFSLLSRGKLPNLRRGCGCSAPCDIDIDIHHNHLSTSVLQHQQQVYLSRLDFFTIISS